MIKLKVDYDHENDSLFLYHNEEGYSEFSEFLTDDIVMDFNENDIPVALEILNASKHFNKKKTSFLNIGQCTVKISINKEKIMFSIKLGINVHNKLTSLKPINLVKANDINLSSSETIIAMT
jgi:uncharacterized protein YuzE